MTTKVIVLKIPKSEKLLIDLNKSVSGQPNYNTPPQASNCSFDAFDTFQEKKKKFQQPNSIMDPSPNNPTIDKIRPSKIVKTFSNESTLKSNKVHSTVSTRPRSDTNLTEATNNISPASVTEPIRDPVANDPNPTQNIDLQAMAAHVMNLQDELHKFKKFVLLVGFVLLAIITTKIAVDLYPKSTVEPMTQLDKNIERQIQLQVIAKFEILIKEEIDEIFTEKFEQTINKQIRTKHTEQLEKVNSDIIKPLEEKIYGPIQSVNMLTKYFYIYIVFSVFVASILFAIPFYLKSK